MTEQKTDTVPENMTEDEQETAARHATAVLGLLRAFDGPLRADITAFLVETFDRSIVHAEPEMLARYEASRARVRVLMDEADARAREQQERLDAMLAEMFEQRADAQLSLGEGLN